MHDTQALKYFSTFSGIGGFELGIERASDAHRGANRGSKENTARDQGQRLLTEARKKTRAAQRQAGERRHHVTHQRPFCVGFSEIDKYAAQIYQRHFPHRQCAFCKEEEKRIRDEDSKGLRIGSRQGDHEGDERLGSRSPTTLQHRVDGHNRQLNPGCVCEHRNYGDITKINAATLPDFDLFVGGFPCQAFSIAGKRRGFEDTRGTLFFDVARILAEKRPRSVLLENVKGLLSHDGGRTFKTIITALVELGYGVEWQVLNSKDFGVPQNRERVFIVGHLGGDGGLQVFPLGGDNSKDTAFRGRAGEVAQTVVATYARNQSDGQYVCERTLVRRLTPTECERLQGFPDGWTEGVSDTQRYKCLGNAVTVNVIEAVFSHLYAKHRSISLA